MKNNFLQIGLVIVMVTTSFFTLNAATAVKSGNWSDGATWGGTSPGSNVNESVTIGTGYNVTMDMDVTWNGGVLQTFTVDGTLSSNTANWLRVGNGIFAISQAKQSILSAAMKQLHLTYQNLLQVVI